MMASSPAIYVSKLEKLRSLGKLEQFSSARHHLSLFNNVALTATYTNSIRLTQTLKQTIYIAISHLISKHPILSTIPTNEDSPHPYFSRLSSIDLSTTIIFLPLSIPPSSHESELEINRNLEEQHNKSFKANYGTLPFWRLLVLTYPESEKENIFTATFIYHHSLGDGISGLIFHQDFLALLSSPQPMLHSKIEQGNETNIISCPLLPLPLNLERLHGLPPPPPTSKAETPDPEVLWTGSSTPHMPYTSNLLTLAIPRATTHRLLLATRAQNTTPTALIPILLAQTLASHLPTNFKEVKFVIPISLRASLPERERGEMGVYIDVFLPAAIPLKVSSHLNWERARALKAALTAYHKEGKTNIASLKEVKDIRTLFPTTPTPSKTTFDVSNLGVFPPPNSEWGNWKIGRVIFSRSAFIGGGAFSTSVITGGDGCLVLGFAWADGVVGREFMGKIVEGVREGLEDFAKGYDEL